MCLCTCKLKVFGQEIGLESVLASLTSTFKQFLAGLLNPSFKKSYMKLLSKKPKKYYIYVVASFSHKKENKSSGYKGPRRIQVEQARDPLKL